MGQNRNWLQQIDDRLQSILQGITQGMPLDVVQEECRSLLADCTVTPEALRDETLEIKLPQILSRDWREEGGMLSFLTEPGWPSFNKFYGPAAGELTGVTAERFVDAFKRVFDFVVASPVSNQVAGDLEESLKTLLLMPWVVDPEYGKLIVTTNGTCHVITCDVDPISQQAVIHDDTQNVKTDGSRKGDKQALSMARLSEWSGSRDWGKTATTRRSGRSTR